MASTNQSPFYQKAQSMFLSAKTDEDRVRWLDEMIKECPKHKSAESMLANLKTRRKKLLERVERAKKSGKGKSGKKGIKKEELQAVIIGKTNSGKSSLIAALTNIHPLISDIPFTTKFPIVGMMNYNGVLIQLVEVPAIESEYYDRGLAHTADLILILVDEVNQIEDMLKRLENVSTRKLIVFNKWDLLDSNERRKIEATLKTRKLEFIIISALSHENLDELKEKIFQGFGKIRVFTKPENQTKKSEKPIILSPNSAVKDVAEKILKGFSKNVKETRIWGPSSKFPGQKVGLSHQLKDLDVVEFKTR
ncbi:MAG: GTPase [Candidatus Pacearchaeota archaeon]